MSNVKSLENAYNTRLCSALAKAQSDFDKGDLTGFSLVTVDREGSISIHTYFERRLELIGALAAASHDAWGTPGN